MNSELEQALTDAITSLAREVRRLRACVLELAGSKPAPSRTCWQCRKPYPIDRDSCWHCFARADDVRQLEETACWSCSKRYAMTSLFCPHCMAGNRNFEWPDVHPKCTRENPCPGCARLLADAGMVQWKT